VLKYKSKKDNWYYKCRGCGKWWFEDAYELFLRDNHPHLVESTMAPTPAIPVVAVQATPVQAAKVVQQPADFRLEAIDLKLGDIKVEMANIKTEMKEMKDIATMFVILVAALVFAVVLNKFM
jgi:hypothetical protein